MGRTSKRKKVDGIQFNIGKRIKVQAQRKFAQGAALLPTQTSKDNPSNSSAAVSTLNSGSLTAASTSASTSQVNAETGSILTRRTEGKPKVYTEDFLTYLCFKGSPSLPPHIRTGSFLQPQSISSSSSHSVQNVPSTPHTSQPIAQIQGFIPFGVRKRASQFPKRVIRKHAIRNMKGKFNKKKPSPPPDRKQLANKRKIFTRATLASKSASKKKRTVTTANKPANFTMATRRQNSQQKPTRKSIPPKINQNLSHQLRQSVSLRNRIVNIQPPNSPEKLRTSVIVKKQVLKKPVKAAIVKNNTTIHKKDTLPKVENKKNSTPSPVTETKKDQLSIITTRNKSNQIKKIESPVSCQTRSAITKLNDNKTPVVVIHQESRSAIKHKISEAPKKQDKFDFSSDDDEPLFKKISIIKTETISKTSEKTPNDKIRLTRSTNKAKSIDSKVENSPADKKIKTTSPIVTKTAAVISNRITRQNLLLDKSQSNITNIVNTPQTRSKGTANSIQSTSVPIKDSVKIAVTTNSPEKGRSILTRNSKVAKKQESPKVVAKEMCSGEPVNVNIKESASKSLKVDNKHSELSGNEVNILDKKMEKSFSDSDDEPLATKVTDTTTRSSICIEKSITKKGDKVKLIDNQSSSSGTVNQTNIEEKKTVIDDNSKSASSVVSDTNPIASYEESLKIFGIPRRNAEAGGTVKAKKVVQAKKPIIPKEPVISETRHEFRGNYESTAPMATQKNYMRNRTSRKFMKSNEYIEQWLRNSASTFTNRLPPATSTAATSTATTSMAASSAPTVLANRHILDLESDIDEFAESSTLNLNTKKNKVVTPNKQEETISAPDKIEEKITASSKMEEIPSTSNRIEEQSETQMKKVITQHVPTEESSNVYEFESDSEIITSPPRKYKDCHKKGDKITFGSNKKVTHNLGFGDTLPSQELPCENATTSKESVIDESNHNVCASANELTNNNNNDTLPPEASNNNAIPSEISATLPLVAFNNSATPSEISATLPLVAFNNNAIPSEISTTLPLVASNNNAIPSEITATLPLVAFNNNAIPSEISATLPLVASNNNAIPSEISATMPLVAFNNNPIPSEISATLPLVAFNNNAIPSESIITLPPLASNNNSIPSEVSAMLPPMAFNGNAISSESIITLPPWASNDNVIPFETSTTLRPMAYSNNAIPFETSTTLRPMAYSNNAIPFETSTMLRPLAYSNNAIPFETSTTLRPLAYSNNAIPFETSTTLRPLAYSNNAIPFETSTTLRPLAYNNNVIPFETSTTLRPLAYNNNAIPSETSTMLPPLASNVYVIPSETSTLPPMASNDNPIPSETPTTDNRISSDLDAIFLSTSNGLFQTENNTANPLDGDFLDDIFNPTINDVAGTSSQLDTNLEPRNQIFKPIACRQNQLEHPQFSYPVAPNEIFQPNLSYMMMSSDLIWTSPQFQLTGDRFAVNFRKITIWDSFRYLPVHNSGQLNIVSQTNQEEFPTNNMEISTNNFEPPSNDFVPPSNDFEPPSNDLEPPSNGFEPPSNDLEPPSNNSGDVPQLLIEVINASNGNETINPQPIANNQLLTNFSNITECMQNPNNQLQQINPNLITNSTLDPAADPVSFGNESAYQNDTNWNDNQNNAVETLFGDGNNNECVVNVDQNLNYSFNNPEQNSNPLFQYNPLMYQNNGYQNNGYQNNGYQNNVYQNNGYQNNGYQYNSYQNNGYPNNGHANNGYPTNGYLSNGHANNGYPINAYPNNGHANNGYPNNGYPNNGYPNNGYPINAYPNNGYPNNGYPNTSYPNNGYPNNSYPNNGYPNNEYPNNNGYQNSQSSLENYNGLHNPSGPNPYQYQEETNASDPLLSNNGFVQNDNIQNFQNTQNFQVNFFEAKFNYPHGFYFTEKETPAKNPLSAYQNSVYNNPNQFVENTANGNVNSDSTNMSAFDDMKDFETQLMNSNNLMINTDSKIAVVQFKPTESTNIVQPPSFLNMNTNDDHSCIFERSEECTANDDPINMDSLSELQNLLMDTNASQLPKPNEVEDHLFYIPLTKEGCEHCNHFIEGVAVQMESEGPEGPQQRVIMRAKLVKKAQLEANRRNNSNIQTDTMLDMVRSVREAFPEATIHSESGETCLAGPSQTQSAASVSNDGASSSNAAPCPIPHRRGSDRIETIAHVNNTMFPQVEDPAQMVEAPVFQPTEKEFQDPLEFFEKISPVAARFGLCKIIPPPSFKSECKISDDMRFIPHNQYLNRMLYRWGPSSREMCAIRKYLATQSVTFKHLPTLSGIEVDLPKLYHIVQEMGGLNKVLEKKLWYRVAEELCIPQHIHYLDVRLDEIYCKYLLPYDTLSADEKKALFESVDKEWAARQQRMVDRAADPLNLSDSDTPDAENDITEDVEECITTGKSTSLYSYVRAAKSTMSMQFGKDPNPSPYEVESKFWDYVTARDRHVCVSTGSIDSSVWGYGFPNVKSKASPIAKHPWNLKVLTNNSGSILRSLGPIMGVNVPTLHVGMLFSTCCWYRDPHGLPWIEYLHEGAPKIWYGVPDSQSAKFKETLTSIVPAYCQKKTIWLLSDTTMVPPTMLTDHGVSLCRTIQNPGEFILVFPKAFTSSICAGYNVSESVYFALNSWLDTAHQDFVDIRNSCEPTMFSLERLIMSISEDVRTTYGVLKKILPALTKIIHTEKQDRERLFNVGLKISERMRDPIVSRKKVVKRQDEFEECHKCRTTLSLSMLANSSGVFCLVHGAEFLISNQSQVDKSKLLYMNSIEELQRTLSRLIERLNTLANKKYTKLKG